MALFIVLDCLPITIKLISPPGEYDLYKDRILIKTDHEINSELDIMSRTFKKKMDVSAKKEEMISVTKITRSLLEDQENERKLLYETLKEMAENAQKIHSEDEVTFHVNYIMNSREIFDESVTTTQKKFREYLNTI